MNKGFNEFEVAVMRDGLAPKGDLVGSAETLARMLESGKALGEWEEETAASLAGDILVYLSHVASRIGWPLGEIAETALRS